MLLKVDCLPNAVGKQPSIPLIYLGRKWTLNWWWCERKREMMSIVEQEYFRFDNLMDHVFVFRTLCKCNSWNIEPDARAMQSIQAWSSCHRISQKLFHQQHQMITTISNDYNSERLTTEFIITILWRIEWRVQKLVQNFKNIETNLPLMRRDDWSPGA